MNESEQEQGRWSAVQSEAAVNQASLMEILQYALHLYVHTYIVMYVYVIIIEL